jgi:glycosyltransferase involved in cell wall biosynthesis
LRDALNQRHKGFIHALKQADAIIRVNRNTIPLLLPFNNEILFIPNGYRPELFFKKDKEELRKKLGLPAEKNILINIGWLTKVKGQAYLISAISEIAKKRKDVLCLIIGIGPLYNKLKKQIDDLGLTSMITLVGKVEHRKIIDWLNASDLFVLSSLSESFGIVVAEALACGKPVVATINGGSEELITDAKVGLLCEKANHLDLADKIEIALDKQWSEDYIANHAKRFEYKHFASEVLKVYGTVMKKHQRSDSQ